MFAVLWTREGIIIPLIFLIMMLGLGFYVYLLTSLYHPDREKRKEKKIIERLNKEIERGY